MAIQRITKQLQPSGDVASKPIDSRSEVTNYQQLLAMAGAYVGLHVQVLTSWTDTSVLPAVVHPGGEYVVTDVNQYGDILAAVPVEEYLGLDQKQGKIDSSHPLPSDSVDDSDSQNKFVTESEKITWNNKQNALTFDDTPTAESNNPVKSGGIKTALDAKQATISDLEQIRSGAQAGASALQPGDITTMIGATSLTDGVAGLVPAPQAGEEEMILQGDGQWVEKPQDGQQGPEGPQGPAGNDGHNPNLGTYTDISDAPDGKVGDYVVIIDTTANPPTAELYIWDATLNSGDGGWSPTGFSPNDAKFSTGEFVVAMGIDSTHLDNSAEGALAKAKDVMSLKQKLNGLSLVESILSADSTSASGTAIAADGTTSSKTGYQYGTFTVTGHKRVRFIGELSKAEPTTTGWCFKNANDEVIGGSRYDWDYSQANSSRKEYVVDIPDGATQFLTNIAGGAITDFYCYLQDGDTAVDNINNVKDEILALMPSVTENKLADVTLTQKTSWTIVNNVITNVSDNLVAKKSTNAIEIKGGSHIILKIPTRDYPASSYQTPCVFVGDENMHPLLTLKTVSHDNAYETQYEFDTPNTAKYLMCNVYNSLPSVFTQSYQLEVDSINHVNEVEGMVGVLEYDSKLKFHETSDSANIVDYRKAMFGTIDESTGVFTPGTSVAIIVGTLPVKPNQTYYTGSGSSYLPFRGYYFYKANGEYISGVTGPNSGNPYWVEFTTPNECAYVYIRYASSNPTSETLKDYIKTYGYAGQYGLTPTEFIPAVKLDTDNYDEFVYDVARLRGKTIAVLGDSIGTREGFNTPEIEITAEDVDIQLSAYVTYNDTHDSSDNAINLVLGGNTYTTADIGTEITFTPIAEDVGKKVGVPLNHGDADGVKWWQILCDRLGMTAVNASYSGASMVSGEADVEKQMTAYAWHQQTIRRCGIRTAGTMTRVAPDYIFIHRGVNDFSTSHNGGRTVLTENTFNDWHSEIPSDDTVVVDNVTKYDFKKAYGMTIQKLREAYPTAKIICCTVASFKRNSETHFPAWNNTYSLPQFNEAIREVARYFDCPVCEFAEAYTFERLSFYSNDNTHPNKYGHRAMYDRAIGCIANNMKFEG